MFLPNRFKIKFLSPQEFCHVKCQKDKLSKIEKNVTKNEGQQHKWGFNVWLHHPFNVRAY